MTTTPGSHEISMDPAQFKDIARHWLTGVSVVTALRENLPFGITLSALTPLSLSPSQFLICVNNNSDTLAAINECGAFCINFLGEGQSELATRFARKGASKFSGVDYQRGRRGMPILLDVVAHVECTVMSTMAGGDHVIIIGCAEHGATSGGKPLAYYNASFGALA